MWSIQIGEIVHNVRSSLDHLVQLLHARSNPRRVRVEDLDLPARAKAKKLRLQFPVFLKRVDFDNQGRGEFLKGVDRALIEMIVAMQPFPVAEGGTGEGGDSPLWHLKELSDCDKHRTLHLTGALLHGYEFQFPEITRGIGYEILEESPSGPIGSHSVLWRAKILGDFDMSPFAEGNVKAKLMVQVAFDHGTPAVGGSLAFDTLVGTLNRTELIVSTIFKDVFQTEL